MSKFVQARSQYIGLSSGRTGVSAGGDRVSQSRRLRVASLVFSKVALTLVSGGVTFVIQIPNCCK